MNSQHHLPYWLAGLYLPGIGPRKFMQWLKLFPTVKTLFHASQEEWQAVGLTPKETDLLRHPDWKSVEKDLAWAQGDNRHILSFEDDDYPPLLKEIPDPPLVLYVRGNKQALMRKQIAIVGSRKATPLGLKNAEQFAHCLVEIGIAITSGLALGIDGASHRGALSAKGVTIGVAGTGLNVAYPRKHQPLIEEIVNYQGAVISEFPPSTPPQVANFPRRNRIISGLSLGVLVVEATLKSGSLITAHCALEQGREVFAIPGSIHHILAKGCNQLIRQGAKLVETASDIIEELGGAFQSALPLREVSHKEPVPALIEPLYQHLLDQIEYENTSIDVIILRSGLTARQVSSMLLTLELQGHIKSVAGGYIRMINSEKY